MVEKIENIIKGSLPDATIFVMDPYNDGQHFQALVISPTFEGASLVEQHQMVMNPLKEALATEVHALGLKTFTPAKWEKKRDQYGL
ncbi:MAG: acid stress-induced BolA-like protein IbaG/YrbA [Cellvibrionaceae bacterium]|jgi:acid stress-induced BolA-like protein IbaG/YrbA